LNRVEIRQLDRPKKLDEDGIVRRTSGGAATNSALFISDLAVATVANLKKVADPDITATVSLGDKFKVKIDETIAAVSTTSGEYVGTLEVLAVPSSLQYIPDRGHERVDIIFGVNGRNVSRAPIRHQKTFV